MPWQMVESARAGYDDLFRRQPAVGRDPICNKLSGLNVRRLHINSADAELFVAE
jgi:hypothetical protein